MLGYRNTVLPRFGMLAGAMVIAIGIGAVMQKGDSAHLTALYAQPDTAQTNTTLVTATDVPPASPTFQIPEVPAPVQMAQAPTTVAPMLQQPVISGIQMTSSDANVSAPADATSTLRSPSIMQATESGCQASVTATPGPAALIDLAVSAPCLPSERIVIHHEGMMFTGQTDADGQAKVIVPALKVESVVMTSFADGTTIMTPTSTPSLNFYDRVVLQWQGNAGLQVHAFEYGATYNQDGHVWAGRPQSIATAAAGDGGFIMQVGVADALNPMLAEVYTFPSGITTRLGDVGLTVEAEITRHNCERDVAAQTLQFVPEQGLAIQDLSFTIPTCQAIGEYLVLNNLLEPVNLAQR